MIFTLTLEVGVDKVIGPQITVYREVDLPFCPPSGTILTFMDDPIEELSVVGVSIDVWAATGATRSFLYIEPVVCEDDADLELTVAYYKGLGWEERDD